MSSYNNPRGMPSMELTEETKTAMEAQSKVEEKKNESEMFSKPNLEIKIDGDKEVEPVAPPVKEKKKRRVTKAQLEALKRGRETSKKNRIAAAQSKKEEFQAFKEHRKEKVLEKKLDKIEEEVLEEVAPPALDDFKATPKATPQDHFNIDYEKIIAGVGNMFISQQQKAVPPAATVEKDLTAFETKIREDERLKLYDELDRLEAEEQQKRNLKQAQQVYTRQPVAPPVASYSYAFSGQAGRHRYSRY